MMPASRTAPAAEVVLQIDWDAFSDETAYLHEIPIGWSEGQTDYFVPKVWPTPSGRRGSLSPQAMERCCASQDWTEDEVVGICPGSSLPG